MAEESPDQAAPDQDAGKRREGRGRLSSIDLLPEEADEAIAWANEQLRERSMPQVIILQRFNAMLAGQGIKPISKGAFSRYSVRVAIEARKLEASRQMTEAILSRLPVEDRSDSTIAATELLKLRLLEMVTDQDAPDPKLLNVATLALQRLSATALREAQGQRIERKDQREEDDRARAAELERQAREAAEIASSVEKIATEAGIGADRIADLRKSFLGVRT